MGPINDSDFLLTGDIKSSEILGSSQEEYYRCSFPSHWVLCDGLLDKSLLYGFFIQKEKKAKQQFQAPETSYLGAEVKKLVDIYDDYTQKLLSNIEGFLEADICSLRKAETTRASSLS